MCDYAPLWPCFRRANPTSWSQNCNSRNGTFFVRSLWWLAFWAKANGAPFFDGFFNELMGLRIWRMSAFFDHSRRKSWFREVFYRIFAPWAAVETAFLPFSAVFTSPSSWLASGAWMFFWSCFGHARRKSWFRIVFYRIFELWTQTTWLHFSMVFQRAYGD